MISDSISRLEDVVENLVHRKKFSSESLIVFVDDGSTDDTWKIIDDHSKKSKYIAGIKLVQNCGHQSALLAGLLHVPGDCLISIDADLQDDIAMIEEMIDKYAQGYHVVYGVRSDRETDAWFKRTSATLFYRLMSFLGINSVSNHADFRLVSRKVVEALREHKEVNLYLRALIPSLGFSNAKVYYKRSERTAGLTKYTLAKMFSLALNGVTSFSVVPLRFISLMGVIVFIGSIGLSFHTLWLVFVGGEVVPGWASTVLPLYLLGGIQLLCFGILGEYIGKIYAEVKARPRFVVEKKTFR